MGRSLICLLVLMTFWGTVTACKCEEKSLEQKYCDSHFVIRLVIRSNLTFPNTEPYGYYDIRSAVLKFPTRTFDRLYTAKGSSACGVTGLQPNRRYLISGRVESELLWIDSCNSILHEGRLTDDYRTLRRNPPTCR